MIYGQLKGVVIEIVCGGALPAPTFTVAGLTPTVFPPAGGVPNPRVMVITLPVTEATNASDGFTGVATDAVIVDVPVPAFITVANT